MDTNEDQTGTEPRRPAFSYSPDRRTALVLCGTGTHGAYHAGVLRALQEAGVKIDLVAGQGVGAAGAALAAIDGGSRLWDADGIWRTPAVHRFYNWNRITAACGWLAGVLGVVLLVPVFVLAAGLIIYPIAFLLTLLGLAAGPAIVTWYSAALQAGFAPESLPTTVPRLAMVVLALLILTAFAGVATNRMRATVSRRAEGGWWWRVFGAPLDTASIRQAFVAALWQLIRGAAPADRPSGAQASRRYAEVLAENLDQPGFRELLVVATDLDAKRDLVAALLREPYRRAFLAPRPGRERRAEVLDLAGVGREHTLEIIAGTLTPPVAFEPALITFAPDSFWRGEAHRLCDRPGTTNRLLEEVAAAGVTQAVIVSAISAADGPHRLGAPRLDVRSRLGAFVAAAESASLRDAIEMARLRFDSIYVIAPGHNPVGPFDFAGIHDAASDRRHDLTELMQRAYEDAYRQFIEPVVGASGDHLGRVATPRGDLL